MDVNVNRLSRPETLTFGPAATISNAIDVRGYAGGMLYFGASYVGGTAAFRSAPAPTATYVRVHDLQGVTAQAVSPQGRAIPIPQAVLAGGHLKINRAVASAAAGMQTVRVLLKG
jgi:hypothetical protein